jgi:hypothetical protein
MGKQILMIILLWFVSVVLHALKAVKSSLNISRLHAGTREIYACNAVQEFTDVQYDVRSQKVQAAIAAVDFNQAHLLVAFTLSLKLQVWHSTNCHFSMHSWLATWHVLIS